MTYSHMIRFTTKKKSSGINVASKKLLTASYYLPKSKKSRKLRIYMNMSPCHKQSSEAEGKVGKHRVKDMR